MENISFEQTLFCQPYHDVISLSEEKMGWQELSKKSPLLSRGWFELALLSPEDRIEFTRLFWLSKLKLPAAHSGPLEDKVNHFFSTLSTIEILLVQERPSLPYLPMMVYSQKKGMTFFAYKAALPQTIARIAQQFSQLPLPDDYLSFFEIHDGFHTLFDRGILPLRDLPSYVHRVKELDSLKREILIFPFCELENLHQVQCFYKFDSTLPLANKQVDLLEWNATAHFSNFIEWLLYYVHSR